MSTTFSVFPLRKEIPTFREVLNLSTNKLNSFLRCYDIEADSKIEATLISKKGDIENKPLLDSPVKWEEDFYAWFYISPIAGGTDAYYWEADEEHKEDWLDELEGQEISQREREEFEKCLDNKIEWNFRRSARQPAIINLAYGLIASSFAELTEGFIWSIDDAWDYKMFPATASKFDEFYFRPERTTLKNKKEWAERCVKNISSELQKAKKKRFIWF